MSLFKSNLCSSVFFKKKKKKKIFCPHQSFYAGAPLSVQTAGKQCHFQFFYCTISILTLEIGIFSHKFYCC